ncbi:hypothetical protein J6590_091905 [Homalodisca vitripennis]|nr:hypothetical protein J6590_091905 [Homalodisca vitripennis]
MKENRSVSVLNLRGSAAITAKRKVSKQRIADVIPTRFVDPRSRRSVEIPISLSNTNSNGENLLFGLVKLHDCRPYVTVNILGKTFEALIDTGAMLTICFPEGRQTVVTAWDPMLEALKEAIDNNYEGNKSSVTFSNPPDSEVKNAVSTSNRTECLSCHEMDELRKESPTPNTYQDVNIQKEAAAEDDFEMVNECDVTLSRASSPCLSIMENSEWVGNELGIDFQETSPKTNLNSNTNYITTIRDTPQPIQPPQPEKTEAPEEINKHVLDYSLKARNVQAASNKEKR